MSSTLDTYLNEDGKLDASSLSKAWFPTVTADVFISHSHNDENEAFRLAGWLQEKFGLTAFIDSVVWNSADALLKKIDTKYCLQKSGDIYDYQKRNLSTSHVHMMLAMAISEMIDKCECLFFLTTPASLTPSKTIEKSQTSSPWIYAEIAISKIIHKRELSEARRARRDRRVLAMDSISNESVGSVPLVHELDVNHLSKVNENQLLAWSIRFDPSRDLSPLDVLYEQIPSRFSGP
ncbi:toll/interleukin-1 receptor domain-containing protein [Xanthomonas hortorum pv. vitians]|uniref:hypothetical protein n=1 Tax=Xanthomonas hortorum TaxID=56454 RepID=UPI0012B9AFB2|nr:hypothetical protein [Xanthomonas hortorum]MCE4279634.1 toll/interleukin-1 receptor domain-containing protein [Xanthomonas hortorum pv. vitians]MCE4286090.1 toll/interleukin-1 receptor domain-containing protein [Xanthomonas hortorum pv. vitians]MDT7819553.1 hypothetical protein [Xanthomonas hortorum pv. vitians]NMI39021.1 hypothetical protein [Xanthomonas hortorum pv. vitians]